MLEDPGRPVGLSAGHRTDARSKAFQFPRPRVGALVHSGATGRVAQDLDKRLAPSFAACRDDLHDQDIGVAIGDQARKPVGFAVDQAKRIARLRRNRGAAKRERRFDSLSEELRSRDFGFVEAPHARADLRGGAVRRPGEESAVRGADLHVGAALRRALQLADRAGKDPGVAPQKRALAAGFERESGSAHRGLASLQDSSDPAGEPEKPRGDEEPQRMDPRGQNDGRGDGRDRESDDRAIGRQRDEISAGEHQPDGHRNKACFNSDAPRRAAKALPDLRDPKGEQARGPAYRRSRHQGAGQSRDFPADQAHHQDVRAGRGLGKRKQIGELRAAHPAVDFHDAAVHLGEHRDRPADREQRQDGKIDGELGERRFAHFALQNAAATPSGATANNTTTSGRRTSAMPAKVATAKSAIAERRRRLAAIFKPMATTRPAAAAETPRNKAETAGRWPYCVYSAPSARTMTKGAAIKPVNAAMAPPTP